MLSELRNVLQYDVLPVVYTREDKHIKFSRSQPGLNINQGMMIGLIVCQVVSAQFTKDSDLCHDHDELG